MSRADRATIAANVRRNGGWWTGHAGILPEPAAAERQRRIDILRATGWVAKAFRLPPGKRSLPGVKRLGRSSWVDLDICGVWDHAYRLVHRSGRVLYVGEPYQLPPDGMGVERLQAAGWLVRVRPSWALHYPGATVAVHVEEPAVATHAGGMLL